MGLYAPAHYLKQFHPKYVSKDDLDKKVKDAKFDNWVRLFLFKNDWALNPELPVLTPWKTVTPINTPTWTLERNPYSVWVDTDGNQLPYIDKVVLTLAENLEVINLRAIAGEYDFQAATPRPRQAAGLHREPAEGRLQALSRPWRLRRRHDHQVQPELRGRSRDRQVDEHDRFPARAVARHRPRPDQRDLLARDRAPRARWCPRTATSTTPDPQYRKLWSTLDVKKANELLDKIGLDKKDAEGYPAAHRRQGPAAHRDHDLGRPVLPVHADLGDDPGAVEEDRHRSDRARGGAEPGLQAHRRQ